jgi:hypothetical protein
MFSTSQLSDIESGMIRPIHGGRLEYYSPTEIRWEPFVHNKVSLWNGNTWILCSCDTYIPIYNTSTDMFGGTLTYGVNYDVFLYPSGSTFVCALSPWGTDTVRSKDLTRFQGIQVYDATTSEGRKYRFIGTIRLWNNSGPVFGDTNTKRLVANLDHKKIKCLVSYNTSTSSWVCTTTNQWVEYRLGGSQIRGEFISLVSGTAVSGFAGLYKDWQHEPTTMGVGVNSTSTSHICNIVEHSSWAQATEEHFLPCFGEVVLGYNYITMLIKTSSSTSSVNCNNGTGGGVMVWVEV